MNPIFAAALEAQTFCQVRRCPFCFIGGLALQRWGEPRLTQDVDLTVISGFGREAEYTDAFLSAFAPRIPDARDFALRHRVLLLLGKGGIPLDIALGTRRRVRVDPAGATAAGGVRNESEGVGRGFSGGLAVCQCC